MDASKLARLNKVYEEYVRDLDAREDLHLQPDRQYVFSAGAMNKGIMMIGEAPGAKEIELGYPFCGMAGGHLDKFMQYLSLDRDDIFICNPVKYRPYKLNQKTGRKSNRTPTKKEVDFCRPYLYKEIDIVQPSLILTLGNTGLYALTSDSKCLVGNCHGSIMQHNGITHIPLYHPASVIYNPSLSDTYFSDLDVVKSVLQENSLI